MAGLSNVTGNDYNVVYSGIRGVDLTPGATQPSRSRLAFAKNVYIDYEGDGGGAIESIPGFRWLCTLELQIKSIYLHRTGDEVYVYLHAGNSLYRSTLSELNKGYRPSAIVGFAGEGSTGLGFGQDSFFLDGQKLVHINKDCVVRTVTGSYGGVYIPTTYANGERFEQGNLLTRSCYESYHIGAADTLAYETEGLQYRIISTEDNTVAVTGDVGNHEELYIPSVISILGEKYLVSEIDDYAFYQNGVIKTVYIADGVKRLGKFAFSQCTALETVITPDSLVKIDNACFSRDGNLKHLHLGSGLSEIGTSTTSLCTSLDTVTYSGSESDFAKILEMESFGGAAVTYDYQYRKIRLALPVSGPAVGASALLIGEAEYPFTVEQSGSRLTRLVVDLEDKREVEGKEAVMTLTYASTSSLYKTHGGLVSSSYFDYLYCDNVLSNCRLLSSYDGRIFASGNPNCPGIVLYSSRDKSGVINPLYFGENDYFDERDGGEVIELLPTSDSLAVFSRSAGGEVSVHYHEGRDTELDLIPRVYPVCYSHRGLSDCFCAAAFFDDYVFLSKNGLVGIDKSEIALSKYISSRSNNVNSYLLREDLSRAKMTVWAGYLIISTEGRMYLADSRQRVRNATGGMEYEWFYLDGIGTYYDDEPIYRYASSPYGSYQVRSGYEGKAVAEGTEVYLAALEGGYRYYTVEDGIEYLVHKTWERRGGSFSPASCVASDGKLLLFGTQTGDICIFNNDMRGVPPTPLYLADDFNEEEYKRAFGARIDPDYYSFAGHAVEYIIRTVSDDVGIPNAEKATVKGTLSVKCNALTRGIVKVSAEASGGSYTEVCSFPSASLCFDSLDFSSLSFSCEDVYTRAFSEKLKRWVEKSVTVSSDEFCSPIAVHSIAYRARTMGKIKNR